MYEDNEDTEESENKYKDHFLIIYKGTTIKKKNLKKYFAVCLHTAKTLFAVWCFREHGKDVGGKPFYPRGNFALTATLAPVAGNVGPTCLCRAV
jgi:hypothetical protein